MKIMKTKTKRDILFAAFIIFTTFSCLLTSAADGRTIFHYNNFYFQLIKTAVVFVICFTVTLINRINIEKSVSYFSYLTCALALLYFVDNYFFKISGYLSFYRLWWLSLIHMCCVGVYLALLVMRDIDFKSLSNTFFKGYSVLHLVTFVAVFLRPYGNEATTNFSVGKGTIRFIEYLVSHPNDSEIWFLLVGNIIFFIPIPFIIRNLFPKIKNWQIILFGLILPFFIEGYQLVLKCGDVDIDDIILNFSGFLIGFLAMKLFDKIKDKKAVR